MILYTILTSSYTISFPFPKPTLHPSANLLLPCLPSNTAIAKKLQQQSMTSQNYRQYEVARVGVKEPMHELDKVGGNGNHRWVQLVNGRCLDRCHGVHGCPRLWRMGQPDPTSATAQHPSVSDLVLLWRWQAIADMGLPKTLLWTVNDILIGWPNLISRVQNITSCFK